MSAMHDPWLSPLTGAEIALDAVVQAFCLSRGQKALFFVFDFGGFDVRFGRDDRHATNIKMFH